MKILSVCTMIAFGYLVGSINPAYIMGRLRGFDIRERGSGNAGATNTFLSIGLISAVVVMALDATKMLLALYLADSWFPNQTGLLTAAGLSVIVGHCFPVFMGFRGGKGFAAYLGMMLYTLPLFIAPIAFVIHYLICGVVNFVLKKPAFGTAVSAFEGTLYFMTLARSAEHVWMGVLTGLFLGCYNLVRGKEFAEKIVEK